MLILEINNLKKYYGDRLLLEIKNLKIYSEDRIGIVGLNGIGKSTLLDIITNRIVSEEGSIKLYGNYSYITQLHDVEEAFIDEKFIKKFNLKEKKKEFMSGGERVKASFAKIILSDINLLVLDEPTNYLDIYSMEAVEKVLDEFSGTMIFVTHDVRFINKLATNLIVFKDNKLISFEGNYEAYIRSGKAVKDDKKELQQKIFVLENRLSQLIGRISMPGKNDNIQELDKEYRNVLQQLKELKSYR